MSEKVCGLSYSGTLSNTYGQRFSIEQTGGGGFTSAKTKFVLERQRGSSESYSALILDLFMTTVDLRGN